MLYKSGALEEEVLVLLELVEGVVHEEGERVGRVEEGGREALVIDGRDCVVMDVSLSVGEVFVEEVVVARVLNLALQHRQSFNFQHQHLLLRTQLPFALLLFLFP